MKIVRDDFFYRRSKVGKTQENVKLNTFHNRQLFYGFRFVCLYKNLIFIAHQNAAYYLVIQIKFSWKLKKTKIVIAV